MSVASTELVPWQLLAQRCLDRTLATAPGMQWHRSGPLTSSRRIQEVRVAVSLVEPGRDAAITVHPRIAVVYRVDRTPTDAGRSEVTDALEQLLQAVSHEAARLSFIASSRADLEVGLERLDERLELRVDAALVRDPEALVDLVVTAFESTTKEMPGTVLGLPPCLQLDRRPRFPSLLGEEAAESNVGACAQCGAAQGCAACTASGFGSREHLRPLRHGDDVTAARACLAALGRSVDVPSGTARAAARMLEALLASRQEDDAIRYMPVEFSLQVRGGRLGRALRFVEYAPQATGDRVESARAQRDRALGLLDSAGLAELQGTYRDFRQLCERGEGDSLELSYGFGLGPEETRVDFQVYAHVDPARSLDGLQPLLAWTRAPGSARETLLPWAAHAGARLQLVDWAPCAQDERRTKLYFEVEPARARSHGGPPLPEWGRLAPFVGRRTLAVAELSSLGLRWVKWDASVRPHFQRATQLERAWLGGVHPDAHGAARQLFSGADFVVWPTWLSVSTQVDPSRSADTLYFVPR